MTEDELKALQEYAAALLNNKDLDLVMELEQGTIASELRKGTTPIAKAVHSGRLRTKVEHNIAVITAGRRHSTPAQNMVSGMLKDIAAQ